MSGPARLFRDHDDNFKTIITWKEFCLAMRARFLPVTSDDAKFFQYLNASQKENETIYDFATRFGVLYDKAKPAADDLTAEAKNLRQELKCADLKPLFLRGLVDKKFGAQSYGQES